MLEQHRTAMESQSVTDDRRFERARALFDELNAADPVREIDNGRERPRLLLQAERLAGWVMRLDPNASEALRLAAHCQHLERWKIPRTDFPEGRVGYLKWRTTLGKFHAARAAEVLRSIGYDEDLIGRVDRIVRKQGMTTEPDTQTMENALCLVFLEHELDAFMQKYPDADKAIDILRKTWGKMSASGREAALTLPLGDAAKSLVARALAP
jgi:hypothetical protein